MARIIIRDLPENQKISIEEMKKISGALARSYVLIINEDGTSYVQFGDGISGAVPPSGRSNISAST